ncbi:efflux RND transporter periplasmic adaptor subunit [Arenibacterium sp. LLYu02]|uniref:efflux RND transporter periplasmic adaptor subunit n=1 Tax=Arenibacterium sp. LLYu02 TaxID=3404132 RepID=UPI003B2252DC
MVADDRDRSRRYGLCLSAQPFSQDHTVVEQAETKVEPIMAVSVITAEHQVVSRRVVAGGTLVPRDEVLVLEQITGASIRSVLAEVGDVVFEGQPLAILDDARIVLLLAQKSADFQRVEAALAQAEALVDEAAAAVDDTLQLFERAVALRERGVVSEQVLEERRSAAETARAREEAQRHALGVAKADLARVVAERDELLWQQQQLTIRAPAAGIVTERAAQEGQAAGSNGTPKFRIAKAGEVEVEALVIETALPLIRKGQVVSVSVAGESRVIEGRVRLVQLTVDSSSRMGKVRISLGEPGLRPGSFASVRFDLNPHEAIMLPHAALLGGGTDAQVMVVRDDVVSVVPVTIGLNTVEGVEIVDGVTEGEIVVASAGGFLREGNRVKPISSKVPVTEGNF